MSKSFSEREGFIKPRDTFQLDGIDKPLRIQMNNWIIISLNKILEVEMPDALNSLFRESYTKQFDMSFRDWDATCALGLMYNAASIYATSFAKLIVPTTEEPDNWYFIYDKLEWFINLIVHDVYKEHSTPLNLNLLNEQLERHKAGYALIKTQNEEYQFTPITNPQELDAIQETHQQTGGSSEARKSLKKALKHIGNREHPNYSACIVDCFNACESAAKDYCGGHDGKTLGAVLNQIPDEDIPPAFKEGFRKYYGYASQFARHGQRDSNHAPSFYEAKFFLVACHAFVNYLHGKKADKTVKQT